MHEEQERAAFVSWLSSTYPHSYDEGDAEHYWRHNHVSVLAWKERASLAKPQPVGGALTAFDEAVAAELPLVSEAPYNSREICQWFSERVRARLATLSAPAAQPGEAQPVAWRYLRKAAPGEGWRYSSHPLADEYGDYQIEALYPRLAAPAQAAAVPEAVTRCECGYPMPCSKTVPINFCKAGLAAPEAGKAGASDKGETTNDE